MSKITMLFGTSSASDLISEGGSGYALFWGTGNGASTHTTYATLVGRVVAANGIGSFDTENKVLTISRAGTYTLSFFGRGGYNSSGTAVNLRYRIYQNDTIVASATNVANGGTDGSVTITAEAGDTIHIDTSNSTNSSNTHDFGYYIA